MKITKDDVNAFLTNVEERYNQKMNPLGIPSNPFNDSLQMTVLRTKNWNRKAEIQRVLKNAEMGNPNLIQHTNEFLTSYEVNAATVEVIAQMVYDYDGFLYKNKKIPKRHYSSNPDKSKQGYARKINGLIVDLLNHTTKSLREIDDIDLMKLRNDIITLIHNLHFIIISEESDKRDEEKNVHPKDIYALVMSKSFDKISDLIEMFIGVKKAKFVLSKRKLH